MIEYQMVDGNVVLIDDCDLPIAERFQWRAYEYYDNGLMYATATLKADTLYMHRVILGAQRGWYVDHINRKGLDNTRKNLRITTQSQNIANAGMFRSNTSGYRGVVWFRDGWRAQLKYKRRNVQSGRHNTPEEAAILRDELARQLFGDTVYLNFPDTIPDDSVVAEARRIIKQRYAA